MAIGLIAQLTSLASLAIPMVTSLSLMTLAVLLLRGRGPATALGGGVGLSAATAVALVVNVQGVLWSTLAWVIGVRQLAAGFAPEQFEDR